MVQAVDEERDTNQLQIKSYPGGYTPEQLFPPTGPDPYTRYYDDPPAGDDFDVRPAFSRDVVWG